MSTTRNYIAIVILAILYTVLALLFAPHNWLYLAVTPTVVAVLGYYLATGAVMARSIVAAIAPLVSLPILVIFFPIKLIAGYVVIHAVLIGAFLGLLWGNVHAFLSGRRTPRL
jgi:hypothetical protein